MNHSEPRKSWCNACQETKPYPCPECSDFNAWWLKMKLGCWAFGCVWLGVFGIVIPILIVVALIKFIS